MLGHLRSLIPPRLLRRLLIAAGAVALGTWLLFFDSHNLVKRVRWHQELGALNARNEELRQDIEALEVQLEELESDEVVEEIAREQYGMRRPGERVYRVEKKQEAGR